MQHRQIVYRLLLPANKKAPEAIDPRGDPLDYPAAGTVAASPFLRLLFAARFDVRRVSASLRVASDRVRVEALIATEVLSLSSGRPRAADRNTIQRGVEELLIMRIGA